jgi:hypothetical protein
MDIVVSYISNFSDVLSARAVCRKWNVALSTEPRIKYGVMHYYIRRILYYDKRVYDENSVRKQLIIEGLRLNGGKYEEKMIPALSMIGDDLDDGDDIVVITKFYLPYEFRIFLTIYTEFPSYKIQLYSPNFMQKVTSLQFTMTRDALLEGRDTACKLVHIHPLCYSKHDKNSITDIQFINILCYVNILGFDINPPEKNDFGGVDERFFVIILELDNLQDRKVHKQLLIEKIKTITDRVESNIEYLEDLDLQTFQNAFETVLRQYQSNM